MASLEISAGQAFSVRLLANPRKFFRWLTIPHVLLSLIMLVVPYYMVVIPLYRMVQTILTCQPRETVNVPGAVVGEFTLFQDMWMVTGELGRIYYDKDASADFFIDKFSDLLKVPVLD